MLDVVLYGYDRRGRLHLRETAFASLGDLARFFSSDDSSQWEWAEVTDLDPDGQARVIRLQADALRSTLVATNFEVMAN